MRRKRNISVKNRKRVKSKPELQEFRRFLIVYTYGNAMTIITRMTITISRIEWNRLVYAMQQHQFLYMILPLVSTLNQWKVLTNFLLCHSCACVRVPHVLGWDHFLFMFFSQNLTFVLRSVFSFVVAEWLSIRVFDRFSRKEAWEMNSFL